MTKLACIAWGNATFLGRVRSLYCLHLRCHAVGLAVMIQVLCLNCDLGHSHNKTKLIKSCGRLYWEQTWNGGASQTQHL